MTLGSAGVGERFALIAGGALALALVQLLQTTLKNSSANGAKKRLGLNDGGRNDLEEVTRFITLHVTVQTLQCARVCTRC